MNRQEKLNHISYIPEIKRFTSYYSIALYYQKSVSEDQRIMKDRLNSLYQDLLLTQDQEMQPYLVPMVEALLENIRNPQLLGSLWKAAIKTLIKLLQFSSVTQQLNQSDDFDYQVTILSLLEAKFETSDQSEGEQMLLLIQKTLYKIARVFQLNEEYQVRIIKYFMGIIKQKTIDDQESNYSLQFSDLSKKYMHKVLYVFISAQHGYQAKILNVLQSKLKKYMAQLPKMLIGANKLKEYICFLIKTLEDCLKKLSPKELSELIMTLKLSLLETLASCGEQEDISIKNQAQQLFAFFLHFVLDHNLPIREELEILLVKIVLKPSVQLAKKIGKLDSQAKNSASTSTSEQTMKSTGTDGQQNDSDYENEDFIQIVHERTLQQDLQLEMSVNYLLETLLSLKTKTLAQLFLLYDSQPFAENFITKSLILILKFYGKHQNQFLQVFQRLIHKFWQFCELNKSLLDGMNQGGPQMISLMLDQKAQIRKLAQDANIKYKVFLKKIEDMYAQADPKAPAEVSSKILLYSREIQIDKVAEIIGGKDDKAKILLNAYLEKLDYKPGDIEQSLRKFLQTYRLAGVDSQVIFRILEQFSHKFHQNDSENTFIAKEEAYEFAYLIIVLQTMQHNPSVKNKTEIKSFLESAHLVCPQSKNHLPEEYFKKIFDSVTHNPFFTPLSRSLLEENFTVYSQTEIDIRLSKAVQSVERQVTENEFVNSADLTQKQLFHYNNSTYVPSTLLPLAAKHILIFLTQKFIKFILLSISQQPTQEQTNVQMVNQKFQILKQLAEINKKFQNYDLVDKTFQVMYKMIIHSSLQDRFLHQMESLLWDNFECIKRSLVLLPKVSSTSFMKDDIKTSLSSALDSMQRLVTLRQQEKKKSVNPYNDKKSPVLGQPPAQQKSFFDLVYNYFTDASEDDKSDEKLDQQELDCASQIKIKLLMDVREEDYIDNIEEKYNEKNESQLSKEKARLQELTMLICSNIKENINQEEGVYCLAFLEHIINQAGNSLEAIEKIWVELHILLNQTLKTKPMDAISLQLLHQSSQEEGKTSYEVISADTSQDSLESTPGPTELDLFVKETSPVRTKIYEAISRHMIVGLHLKISKKIIKMKAETGHILRDIQRAISCMVEGDSQDKNFENYQLYDDLFFYQRLSSFIQDLPQIKSYSKLSKLIRLMLILILKSQTRKIEEDQKCQDQTCLEMQLFQSVTQLICESSSNLPYDLIELSLDVFDKIKLPDTKSRKTEQTLESAVRGLENLAFALKKHILINFESQHKIWLNIIQMIQERVLFNPICKKYENASIQAFNVMKNMILNHPFEVEPENFKLVKQLFSDILFWQTFEKLNLDKTDVPQTVSKVNQKVPDDKKQIQSKVVDEEFEEDYELIESQLQHICLISVSNLSDIFIYYMALIFKDNHPSQTKQPAEVEASQGEESAVKLFTFLWLSLLKVLLHYAEKGDARDFHQLVQGVHDNIKRIIEFLILQGIIFESHQNQELAKLWKTTWEIIGAFFPEMKNTVIEGRSSLNRDEPPEFDNQPSSNRSQERSVAVNPSSFQNPNPQRSNEVAFFSCDNLFRESLVGHRELAMKKGCKCKFAFDPQRTFQSYCYEFCGLLNIQMQELKFFLKDREVPYQRQTRKPCTIHVYHFSASSKPESNSLKPAFSELFEKGLYSDITLIVNGEAIKAHRCVLIARSEKFRVMLQQNMREKIEGRVEISNTDITPQIYKKLLQWIYEGECDVPGHVQDLLSLLKLTDEYLLPDLQKVCEEQIIDQMDFKSAVEILTNCSLVFPNGSDLPIKDAAKTVLLEDYEKAEELYPDIEVRISKVKGLMSELFTFKKKKRSHHRKRKNSIVGEDSQKKKVRFNISNTIYEEASAIHEESDSMIEPLSIYSINSPPGELNDDLMVSQTHSIVSQTHSSSHAMSSSVGQVQRRNSGTNQTNNSNINLGASSQIQSNNNSSLALDNLRVQSIDAHGPAQRLHRPASV